MIILSDCLTETPDEGCLKVANSLTRKIKERYPDVTVISCGERGGTADLHLRLNKLFLNRELLARIYRDHDRVLYIPFSSNTVGSAIRTWVLSWAAGKRVSVLFTLLHPRSRAEKLFLSLSGAKILALSEESAESYSGKRNPSFYLRTGINTERFMPVSHEKKTELRKKYGVDREKPMILHVGHMTEGRNIRTLLQISERYQVVLVISTETKKEQDERLRAELLARTNITIIDSWQEHIEEIYQMADIYYFPVRESEHCIDNPLSVLEAAACNLPVVTTDYGELKRFKGEPGFYFLSSFEPERLNAAFSEMETYRGTTNRTAVLPYDWGRAVEVLTCRKEG